MSIGGPDPLLAAFAAAARARPAPGIGEPEDNLRAPFEGLFVGLASLTGQSVTMVGEALLAEERTKPDYAVLVGNATLPVGFVELKAPGVGRGY